ncbi:MAG TPA: septum formation initiator family protein [Candidatus Magasanikbacteria bacterium]|nr:septum formation initiator family protein [Candidatus Magasanikbacteria bacterium]
MSSGNRQLKKFFNSYWFLLVMLVIFFVFSGAFIRSYYQDYQIKKEIEDLQKQAAEMEAKKLKSLELLSYFQSEEFVEKKAREELNLIKSGEQAAIVRDLEGVKKNGQPSNDVIKSDLPNYKKWWFYFFNHN